LPSAWASATRAAASFFFPRRVAQNASATPTSMPASTPGERELEFEFEFEVTARPVPLKEELLVDVIGLSVSEPDTKLEVVVAAEEVVLCLKMILSKRRLSRRKRRRMSLPG